MKNKKLTIGLSYAFIAMILVGLQPIIALGRDEALDPYFFTGITCLYQAILFIPITLIYRRKLKNQLLKEPNQFHLNNSLLYSWKKKKNVNFLLYIGISFSISQILYFTGLDIAGAVNGALTQKTTILFGLLFGYLINQEKVTGKQIFFSFILMTGLIISTTQGQFNLLNFNLGVILIIITSMLWMLAHSITKPMLNNSQILPSQLVLFRNFMNGIVIIILYIIFFPIENFELFLNPYNQLIFIAMALAYGIDLLCWYSSLNYLDVSKATIIMAPTPIVTAIFSMIILGELFTIYHLIGTIIILLSIIMIIREK